MCFPGPSAMLGPPDNLMHTKKTAETRQNIKARANVSALKMTLRYPALLGLFCLAAPSAAEVPRPLL